MKSLRLRPKALFFDAAGTLINLREPVGDTYARTASKHGIQAASDALEASFRRAWKNQPQPQHDGVPPADGERGWWADLVATCFADVLGRRLDEKVMSPLFDELYDNFACAEAWKTYPETRTVLEQLHGRFQLFVLSNFDARLKPVLEGLRLRHLFESIILSSEVGHSKPHPALFTHASRLAGVAPAECLHVGDENEADFLGAQQAGFQACLIRRPETDLKTLVTLLLD